MEHLNDDSVNVNVDVAVLTIHCTPSMKSEVLDVTLCFTTGDRQLLGPPFTICTCPAGRWYCSHLLAFVVFIGFVQDYDVDWSVIESCMPEPVKSISRLPIPLLYVNLTEPIRLKETKAKRRTANQKSCVRKMTMKLKKKHQINWCVLCLIVYFC